MATTRSSPNLHALLRILALLSAVGLATWLVVRAQRGADRTTDPAAAPAEGEAAPQRTRPTNSQDPAFLSTSKSLVLTEQVEEPPPPPPPATDPPPPFLPSSKSGAPARRQ